MRYDDFLGYTSSDFIHDDEFVRWVLHPTEESDRFYGDFLKFYPDKSNQVEEAILFIKNVRVDDPKISQQLLDGIYQTIRANTKPQFKINWMFMKVAAVFLLLVTVGGLFYFLPTKQQLATTGTISFDQVTKGMIVLPDGTISDFESRETNISQTESGKIVVNNDTLSIDIHSTNRDPKAMAQVIIPYGQRSQVKLSDGTRIWLNAGSQLNYPLNFTGNVREVYLSGEAFFEVESDPQKPFHVITNDLKIRVTGTRFNVTSYENDLTTQAVLYSGKISAAKNKLFASMENLRPGERIVYHKGEEKIEIGTVNVELYSSWLNGYLIFDNEPVENIFKKLERYYNRKIKVGSLTEQIVFTGKLDLATNLDAVLRNMAFSGNFSVVYEGENYLIQQTN